MYGNLFIIIFKLLEKSTPYNYFVINVAYCLQMVNI
jgi:hypothetical protein